MSQLRRKSVRVFVLASVLALVGALMAVPASAKPGKGAENSREVHLQILAINDFHGNIATSSGSFGGTGRADNTRANDGGRSNHREMSGKST